MQFDGGSAFGAGTGGFVIMDPDGKEGVRAGEFFGEGFTNNEAETMALHEGLN